MGLVTGGHVTSDQILPVRGSRRSMGGGRLGRRQGPISHIVGGVQASRSGGAGTGVYEQQYPGDDGYRQGPGPGPAFGSRNPRERLVSPMGGGALGGIQKKLKSVSYAGCLKLDCV